MLAQGHTETEIAQLLHVHVSTISRDVKVLKELSQRFVFDLAKGDLTYYYKQCIDGMDEIRREAWSLYKYGDWSQGVHLTVKEKLATLKLLKECNEAKFALLEKGPSVLNVKGMEESDFKRYDKRYGKGKRGHRYLICSICYPKERNN